MQFASIWGWLRLTRGPRLSHPAQERCITRSGKQALVRHHQRDHLPRQGNAPPASTALDKVPGHRPLLAAYAPVVEL